MDAVADLAEDYSHDEVRVSHEQNLILPHVALDDLPAVYDRLASVGLVDAERRRDHRHHLLPRPRLLHAGDRALDPRRAAHRRALRRRPARERDRSAQDQDLRLHQRLRPSSRRPYRHSRVSSGQGRRPTRSRSAAPPTRQAAIGQITGPGFSSENVVDAIETIVETYTGLRLSEQETFIDAYRRVGMAPFKEALYERSAGSDI